MTAHQYKNQIEILQDQNPRDLLAKVKAVIPFQEEARLFFGIYKKEETYFLRLSPVGIAYDHKEETAALNYLLVQEQVNTLLIVRRWEGFFQVNFNVPEMSEVYLIDSDGALKVLAHETKESSDAIISQGYDKKAVLLALRNGLRSKNKQSKIIS